MVTPHSDSASYQLFMLALCIYTLVALGAEAVFKPGGETRQLLAYADTSGRVKGVRSACSVTRLECLVRDLLRQGGQWIGESDAAKPLTGGDLRVVAPFNAQVNRLAERLARWRVPVGTVDKFQGQTAAVVIYSMTTSRPKDAPRGMEFLYSLNRLNVATSRARCAVFLVASPKLFAPECRTPARLRLANAMCRYKEMASELLLSAIVASRLAAQEIT